MRTLEGGERQTLQCDDCSREFDIIYEAKLEGARENEKAAAGIEPASVEHCPFCGSRNIAQV